LRAGAVLARLLQALVLWLEAAIEWLGHEPERRWEQLLFLRGLDARAPPPAALARRALLLARRGDGEGALRLYVKVLELEPDNCAALDAAAEILAELGDAEGAKELLHKSVELSPARGHEKYVLLGHLDCGASAVRSFERGLELLEAELRQLAGPGARGDDEDGALLGQRAEVRAKMAEVLTAMAKVYLTDCFMERDAHSVCEELLDRSLTCDADNPETTQALADLRLSQGRRGEALLLVRRTMELCAGGCGGEGVAPSYDFRCVTARLLVELSRYELAEQVLVELAAEDDQDTEVWYLLGLCYLLLDMPKKCREALLEAKQQLEQTRNLDTTLLNQINSLLERRSMTEEEKATYWNPRWWINDSGKAESRDVEPMENGIEKENSAIVHEMSIMLSSTNNAPCPSNWPAIPEEVEVGRSNMPV